MNSLKTGSNSIGASYYGEEKTNAKSSLYFNSSYSLNSYLNVNFNLMKDFYREDVFQYGEFDNLIIRAGVTAGF
ncbi:MAG: hypothetical protein IPG09_15740 [Ignavibacteria bacterium]|nr:hypothetical protein [Ignavibacteria bacterium]